MNLLSCIIVATLFAPLCAQFGSNSEYGTVLKPLQISVPFQSLINFRGITGTSCLDTGGCDITNSVRDDGYANVFLTKNVNEVLGQNIYPPDSLVQVFANGVIRFKRGADKPLGSLTLSYASAYSHTDDSKAPGISNTSFNICTPDNDEDATVCPDESQDFVTFVMAPVRLSVLECFANDNEQKKFVGQSSGCLPRIYRYRTNPAEGLGGSTIISWEDMMFNRDIPASSHSTNCANYPNNSRSSFQAEIFDDGNIRLSYLKVSLGATQKCTIGYEDPQYTPDHYFGFPAPIADCDAQGSCNVVPTGSGLFYCE